MTTTNDPTDSSIQPVAASAPHSPWRLRFRLRTLLILITFMGAFIASLQWGWHHIRRQSIAADYIRSVGGRCTRDYTSNPPGAFGVIGRDQLLILAHDHPKWSIDRYEVVEVDLTRVSLNELQPAKAKNVWRELDYCLRQFPKLHTLQLRGNAYLPRTLRHFRHRNLSTLELAFEPSEAVCAEVGGISTLHTLSLDSTHLTDRNLRDLGKLPHLKELQLYNLSDHLHLQELGQPPALQTVSLAGEELSGENLSQLPVQLRLKHCSIYSQRDLDAACSMLRNLPALESLSIVGSCVTDEGAMQLSKCDRLKVLGLLASKITGAAFEREDGWRNLEELHATAGTIGDEDLKSIANLPSLRKISIVDQNQLTIEGVAAAPWSASLADIELECSGKVKESHLVAFQRLPLLKSLVINRENLAHVVADLPTFAPPSQ